MAGIAFVVDRYMISVFAVRNYAIVATGAIANDMRMIHDNHRYPGGIVVAGLTDLSGRNMIVKAAGGIHAVMTTKTRLSDHRIVVESDRPVHGGMACVARLRGCNMGGVFPGCNDAVVTTFTASYDMVVIHMRHAPPVAHNMAGITYVGTGDVQGRLAGGSNIIMATLATSRDMIVIHCDNWTPNTRRVARITAIGRSDMPGVFAGGCDTFVAAYAWFSYFTVVHFSDRYPS